MNRVLISQKNKIRLGIDTSSEVEEILSGALAGDEVSLKDGITLFESQPKERNLTYQCLFLKPS